MLAMQDVFSRFCLLVPTKACKIETAVQVAMDRWVCQFGVPLAMQSDQSPHFTVKVSEEMCRQLGVGHRLSSPNHPCYQGQVERQNQLLNIVRCVIEDNSISWPRAVIAIQLAHNTAVNETTGYSPHQLLYNQEPRRPESLLVKRWAESKQLAEMRCGECRRIFVKWQ